jgi:hypothetical protein
MMASVIFVVASYRIKSSVTHAPIPRSFPRKRESRILALGPRFRGDERKKESLHSSLPDLIRQSRFNRQGIAMGIEMPATSAGTTMKALPRVRGEEARSRLKPLPPQRIFVSKYPDLAADLADRTARKARQMGISCVRK